jgi:hypothetical protein
MKTVADVRTDFYAEAGRFPKSEDDFEAQKELFRKWRDDPRFEPYWFVLDALLNRSFDQVRKWAGIQAQLPVENYDYDATRKQDEADLEDAHRRRS